MSPTRKRRSRRTGLLVALAAVVAVAAVAVAALLVRPADTAATTSPAPEASIAPGQASGAAATSSAPFTIEPEPSFVATDEPRKVTPGHADVVLTYAGFDESRGTVTANGFAAGVVENGGTCTLTLTRGAEVVTATTAAEADATTTSCGLLEGPPGLTAGTWHAVLTYASDSASGESDALEVSVR